MARRGSNGMRADNVIKETGLSFEENTLATIEHCTLVATVHNILLQ
jgi:hypothetical protein